MAALAPHPVRRPCPPQARRGKRRRAQGGVPGPKGRRGGAGALAAVLVLLLALAAAPARACRLALVLAMDVSASVDAQEYRLQTEGTASALLSDPVRAVALAGEPVAVAVFMWSGVVEQARVAGWDVIDSPTRLEALAARIAAHPRPAFHGRTAIGAALRHGAGLLDAGPDCARRVIDLSGDGENNDGPAPERVRDSGLLRGITVNGLTVGGDLPMDHGTMAEEGGALSRYFAERVIHGPGAFVERAEDYRDFRRAMTRKLERELAEPLLGRAPPAVEFAALPRQKGAGDAPVAAITPPLAEGPP